MKDSSQAHFTLPDGRVYVLLVWQEGTEPWRQWRATLRDGANGKKRHFASIDDCIEHLYSVIAGH